MAIVSCGLALLLANREAEEDEDVEGGVVVFGCIASVSRGLRWDEYKASLLRHSREQNSASAEAYSS